MSDSIIHRWSQRKADQHGAEKLPTAQIPESEITETESEAKVKLGAEAEDKREVELPSLDSLGDESDYSSFLSPEVDEGLRKMALRKLFKAPFFNVLDGLNDYDEDFTTFADLGDIVTADMKYHAERKEAERLEAERESIQQQQVDEAEVETLAEQDIQNQEQQDSAEDSEIVMTHDDNSVDDQQDQASQPS